MAICAVDPVSVLFNEPKLLKYCAERIENNRRRRFSALQRAEIAEIYAITLSRRLNTSFSALQRAEIAEIDDAGAGRAALLEFQCSSTSRNC